MTARRTKRWWRDLYMASHYAALNSPEILAVHMRHKGFDTVKLASAATNERIRRGTPKKVSPQFIGQLRNGRVHSCTPHLAEAIEAVLDVPAGVIFTVLAKSSDTRETAKAGVA